MGSVARILVPVDFSPSSDAALDYALSVADKHGAEVEVLHVWCPPTAKAKDGVFAESPEGVAMEMRLSAAETDHAARVCGRLELGEEPSHVILEILRREPFDLVVMGLDGGSREDAEPGHVAANVAVAAPCKVVTRPPPPSADDDAA